jgi:thiol-disulfide isomerase/thioredoxin
MRTLRGCIALLVLLAGAERVAAQDSALKLGDRAPRVVVHDLNGKPVNLGEYVGVKPMFLEFWATWCESCRHLMPHVQAAQKTYGSKVEFIGINVAVNETPAGVQQFMNAHAPGFRTLYDDEGNSTRAYQAPATSYVVVVDRSGKVAYTGIGGTQDFDGVLRRVSQ